MTAIANLPDLRPSLLLDFANSGRVDPRVKFTRASTATCWGPDGKLRTVAANVPRIDYDPATGKCLGLLEEEARTNLILNSSVLEGTGWASRSVVLQESAETSPIGFKYKKIIIPEGVSSGSSVFRPSDLAKVASPVTYSFTAIAKAGENNILRMSCRDTASSSNSIDVRFDLLTGLITQAIGQGSYTLVGSGIKHLGEGTYECHAVYTTGSETSTRPQIVQMKNSNAVVGNGVDGIYVAGVQLEVGSFPTSYINTGESSVTRAADFASIPEQRLSAFGTLLVKYKKAGRKNTNAKPPGGLDLSSDIATGLKINDHVERVVLYPRQLTAAQITRLTA